MGLFSKLRTDLDQRPLLTISGARQLKPEGPGSLERRYRLFAECVRTLAGEELASERACGTPVGDGLGMEQLVARLTPLFDKEKSLIRWVALRGALCSVYIYTLDPESRVLPFSPVLEGVMGIRRVAPGTAEETADVLPEWQDRLSPQQRAFAVQVYTAVREKAYDYERYSELDISTVNQDPRCYLDDAMALDFIAWSAVAFLRTGFGEHFMAMPEPDALDAPGWYADPLWGKAKRYWDGSDWTDRGLTTERTEVSAPLRPPPDPPRLMPAGPLEPTTEQILSEWPVGDPGADLARWREGMARYDAAELDDRAEMFASAELMCAALPHYLRGDLIMPDVPGRLAEAELVQTVWNVLVAALRGNDKTTWGPGSERHVRLALASARHGGMQTERLGGRGTLSRIFEDRGHQMLMIAALWAVASSGALSFTLDDWFKQNPGSSSWKAPLGTM